MDRGICYLTKVGETFVNIGTKVSSSHQGSEEDFSCQGYKLLEVKVCQNLLLPSELIIKIVRVAKSS